MKLRWPYWLRSHEQHCAGCDAPHAHAVTVHCVACDREHCPLCVVEIEGELFCSTCAKKKGGRRKWQRARSGKAS